MTAHDAKGAPVTDLKYDTKVVPEGDAKEKYSEPVNGPLARRGDIARGEFIARNAAPRRLPDDGHLATRDGKEVGRDSARFIVYEDDRELENPAADRALLRRIRRGDRRRFRFTPEQLPKFLQSLRGKLSAETSSLTEKKVWDNWPLPPALRHTPDARVVHPQTSRLGLIASLPGRSRRDASAA